MDVGQNGLRDFPGQKSQRKEGISSPVNSLCESGAQEALKEELQAG